MMIVRFSNWKKIQVFNPAQKWQWHLAAALHDLCRNVAFELGTRKEGSSFFCYQDDCVKIECDGISEVKVILAKNDMLVLDAYCEQSGYYYYGRYENTSKGGSVHRHYDVFHAGAWIDHVVTLRPQIREARNKRNENRKTRAASKIYERFKKLD